MCVWYNTSSYECCSDAHTRTRLSATKCHRREKTGLTHKWREETQTFRPQKGESTKQHNALLLTNDNNITVNPKRKQETARAHFHARMHFLLSLSLCGGGKKVERKEKAVGESKSWFPAAAGEGCKISPNNHKVGGKCRSFSQQQEKVRTHIPFKLLYPSGLPCLKRDHFCHKSSLMFSPHLTEYPAYPDYPWSCDGVRPLGLFVSFSFPFTTAPIPATRGCGELYGSFLHLSFSAAFSIAAVDLTHCLIYRAFQE